eukprot:13337248-Alexandrium_andersonii.AAC.1
MALATALAAAGPLRWSLLRHGVAGAAVAVLAKAEVEVMATLKIASAAAAPAAAGSWSLGRGRLQVLLESSSDDGARPTDTAWPDSMDAAPTPRVGVPSGIMRQPLAKQQPCSAQGTARVWGEQERHQKSCSGQGERR